MKTFRTVITTVGCICIILFGVSLFLLWLRPVLLQRTVFYLLQQLKFVLLILALSFFLIYAIVSLSLRKMDNDSDEEMELDVFQDINIEEHARIENVNKKDKRNKVSAEKVYFDTEYSDEQFSFDDCINIGAEYIHSSQTEQSIAKNRCVKCGAKLSKNSMFCDRCGNKIS